MTYYDPTHKTLHVRFRWWFAWQLNRLPGTCWSHLVSWALGNRRLIDPANQDDVRADYAVSRPEPIRPLLLHQASGSGVGRMTEQCEHKWVDVRGWGGARPGTEQCDLCYRVRGAEQAAAARREAALGEDRRDGGQPTA